MHNVPLSRSVDVLLLEADAMHTSMHSRIKLKRAREVLVSFGQGFRGPSDPETIGPNFRACIFDKGAFDYLSFMDFSCVSFKLPVLE